MLTEQQLDETAARVGFISHNVRGVATDILLATKRRAVLPSSSLLLRVSKLNITYAQTHFL
jgi:hypothetical protein